MNLDVRFTLKSRLPTAVAKCPLGARTGHPAHAFLRGLSGDMQQHARVISALKDSRLARMLRWCHRIENSNLMQSRGLFSGVAPRIYCS